MSMAMDRVHIPCPHKNNNGNTLSTAQQKVLNVKFIHRDGSHVAEFVMDPLCSACQGDIIVFAMAQGRTPEFCTDMQEDILEVVRDKITEIQIDEDYAGYSFVIIHSRDDYELIGYGNEEVVMHVPMERTFLEESFAAAVRTTPATEEAIEALERLVKPSQENSTCSICLGELTLNEDQVGRRLPCKHEFHENCIVEWLHTSHFCPLCRFQLPIA